MDLLLLRHPTLKATPGDLLIGADLECHTLEDKDRGLVDTMTLAQIKKAKVYGQTAIPKGKYEIAITYSNNFKRYLPLLLNVPGYDGVRIHSGNTAADTLGCILVGGALAGDTIKGGTSRPAFDRLFAKLQAAAKKEKIWITIT